MFSRHHRPRCYRVNEGGTEHKRDKTGRKAEEWSTAKVWGGGWYAEATHDVLSGNGLLRDNWENEGDTEDRVSGKVENESLVKGARHRAPCYDRPDDVLRDNARVYRVPSYVRWYDSRFLRCRRSPKRLQLALRTNFTLGSIVTNFLKPVMLFFSCMEQKGKMGSLSCSFTQR